MTMQQEASVARLAEVRGAASSTSAVSWAAIIAGGLAAVAITVILLELGVGIGLVSTSAWPNMGAAPATIGVVGGLWLIIVQWLASGVGGYMAGRLRTKWVGVHTDEVFFRDTAHGFLAWCAATLIGLALVAAAASAGLNAGSRVAAGGVNGAAQAAGTLAQGTERNGAVAPFDDPYYADLLFRAPTENAPVADSTPPPGNGAAGNATPATPSDANAPTRPAGGNRDASSAGTTASARASGQNVPASRNEVSRILARDLRGSNVSPDDRAYLTELVAARTGLTQTEASHRVDTVIAQMQNADTQARAAADQARKTAATAAIVTSLAMLIGAFIASVCAALGGRLRDEY